MEGRSFADDSDRWLGARGDNLTRSGLEALIERCLYLGSGSFDWEACAAAAAARRPPFDVANERALDVFVADLRVCRGLSNQARCPDRLRRQREDRALGSARVIGRPDSMKEGEEEIFVIQLFSAESDGPAGEADGSAGTGAQGSDAAQAAARPGAMDLGTTAFTEIMCFELVAVNEDHFEIEPLVDEFTELHPENEDLICSRQLALRGLLHRVSWTVTPTDIEEEERDLLVRTYLYGDSIEGPPDRQDQIPVTIEIDDKLMETIAYLTGLLAAIAGLIWAGRRVLDAIRGRGSPPSGDGGAEASG